MKQRTERKSAGRRLAALALTCVSGAALARTADTQIAFVGCPIMRNTALPCWLGESGGELYYLGPQGDLTADFYPPQFGHRMLVQGVIVPGERICGGIVLRPAKVSVLPAIDVACNVMLPADAYPDPPNNRGAGPSGVKGAAPPPPPRRPAAEQFVAPFHLRQFTADFYVDSERMWRSAQTAVENAARFAEAAHASRIDIVAYRGAVGLSNGNRYVEAESIARDRAAVVRQGLLTVGVPASTRLEVHLKNRPLLSTSVAASPPGQRVLILVSP